MRTIALPILAAVASLPAFAEDPPANFPPELLDGPRFSMRAAFKVMEDAAAAGRLDILSFALRRGSSPVAMSVFHSSVYSKLNDAQRATLLAEALTDNTIWPSSETVLRSHGPLREEFFWHGLYTASATLLGLAPKPFKYPAATERHELATKLKERAQR